MKRILILVGSMRKGGNTSLLANAFAEGAAVNNKVEIVSVADYKVNPCIGCNTCFKSEGAKCFQHDDMSLIYEKLKNTDVLVIASPVYFYGISAELKAMVDRLHSPMRKQFPIKQLALILAGADNSPKIFDAIKVQYQLILNHFNLQDAGRILVNGVFESGDVAKTNALNDAYNLGLTI